MDTFFRTFRTALKYEKRLRKKDYAKKTTQKRLRKKDYAKKSPKSILETFLRSVFSYFFSYLLAHITMGQLRVEEEVPIWDNRYKKDYEKKSPKWDFGDFFSFFSYL